MSAFTEHGGFIHTGNGNNWRAVTALVYRVGGVKSNLKITVPAGAIINFASVGFLRGILPSRWVYTKASGLHDYMYGGEGETKYNKVSADFIFYESMLVEGIPKVIAILMYMAVFWFGHKAYKAGVYIEHD